MSITLDIKCAVCGEILEGYLDVTGIASIEPCQSCIDGGHAEGYEEGYRKGKQDGYEEIRKDVLRERR